MGGLLERDMIKHIFDSKYPLIVDVMMNEMDTAKEIYDEQVARMKTEGEIMRHKNMPKIAGSLRWTRELRLRISKPMAEFKNLEHPCMLGEKTKLVFTKYEEMLNLISG